VVAEGLSAKQEICRQVEDYRIDLLLLGTRGLGTLTK
jgi:nucleotide-binding universal stress UspA family protein